MRSRLGASTNSGSCPGGRGPSNRVRVMRSIKRLHGCSVHATDGEYGRVQALYFDDRQWAVRYLVVALGHWLPGPDVLVPPRCVQRVEPARRRLNVALTKIQLALSPNAETDIPVSRQQDVQLMRYYGFPYDWTGRTGADLARSGLPDPHLRSTRDVIGYHVHAADDEIGHAADFLVDEKSWTIRYVVINTRNWWQGKTLLLPTAWITSVSRGAAMMHVGLRRDEILHAPQYDRRRPIGPREEQRLSNYYGRPGQSEPRPRETSGR